VDTPLISQLKRLRGGWHAWRLPAFAWAIALAATGLEAQAVPEAAFADPSRAYDLYVSNDPADHDAGRDYESDVRARIVTDSLYRQWARGSYRYDKVTYPSRADGLGIPAHVFRPLTMPTGQGYPVLVWVHGGVHSHWGELYLPFVREATARGYMVVAPDYRGSTGYGKVFHDAIDYGGYEVDDVISAIDHLRDAAPDADLDRVAVMGWSHGGYIASLAVFREEHPFRAAVAIVPVSNLVFRLAYKGPSYQALFSTQERIGGLPHERRDLYIERSPVYQVDALRVPLMVHVATNDDDVDFVEAEMFLHALQVKQPELAETRVYVDPPGGHLFSRLVDVAYRVIETAELLDSWARTWAFLERNLAVAPIGDL
jgi:dipeptidyl aminopeptidase/acylaminoacyl peptidase